MTNTSSAPVLAPVAVDSGIIALRASFLAAGTLSSFFLDLKPLSLIPPLLSSSCC